MKKFVISLTQCAVMLALSAALSFIKLWSMPLGGSVTLVSMLPICLIAIKFGLPQGLGTAFVYSLFQLLQAIIEGDVFIYCEGWVTVVVCVFFDYLLPFTVLGLAGIFKKSICCTKRKAAKSRRSVISEYTSGSRLRSFYASSVTL